MSVKKFFKYVMKNNQSKIKEMVENGFDIDTLNTESKEAQLLAFEQNNFELLDFLYQLGANPFGSVFLQAAKEQDDELFNRILPYMEYDEVKQRVSFPLHQVAQLGTVHQIQSLLEKGYLINYRDSFGRTPIMYAASREESSYMKVFLDFNCKLDLVSLRGYSVVQYIKHSEVNEEEKILLLIEKGVSLEDIQSTYRNQLVIECVKKEYLGLLKKILQLGADPNIQDEEGKTGLMYAVEKMNLSLIHLLLFYNANPLIENKEKQTALMHFPEYEKFLIFYMLKSAEYKHKKETHS